MIKLLVKPQWALKQSDRDSQALPNVLELCGAINESGNLVEACRRVGLSYRHGWGILREAGRSFGVPLVSMTRGRGAKLTVFGEKLLWADKRIAARLSPVLDTLASEVQAELERSLRQTSGIMRIHASHGFAVAALHDALTEQEIAVELKYVSSQEAVASLGRAGCDLAGFHLPLGELQARALQHYQPLLRPRTQRLINLATRRQGIMVPPGNPKKIHKLQDLQRKGVRFVNRQADSGTRILLDLLLEKHRIASAAIDGYEVAEYTHAAVAAYIASGMADAGFGIETGARRFNLEFIPIATERYFMLCPTQSLESRQIQSVLQILLSPTFKGTVNKLPGYDAAQSGSVLTLSQAFS